MFDFSMPFVHFCTIYYYSPTTTMMMAEELQLHLYLHLQFQFHLYLCLTKSESWACCSTTTTWLLLACLIALDTVYLFFLKSVQIKIRSIQYMNMKNQIFCRSVLDLWFWSINSNLGVRVLYIKSSQVKSSQWFWWLPGISSPRTGRGFFCTINTKR